MATTDVELCNIALFRVRAEEIGSFNEQSRNAEKCRILYPQVRDTILNLFPWSFTRAERTLSTQTSFDPVEWEYCLDYPVDCLHARYLVLLNEDGESVSRAGYSDYFLYDPIPFEIGITDDNIKAIFCNYEQVRLVYTKKITDVRLWDPLVDELISWKMASELAIPLGGDSAKKYRDDALQQFNYWKGQAEARNANERRPRRTLQAPRSIQVRDDTIPRSRDEIINRGRY